MLGPMKCLIILGLVCAGMVTGDAQELEIPLEDFLSAGQEWLKANVDDSVWRILPEIDQARARQLFQDLQERLAGEYVIDLAQLKPVVTALLPTLEGYEETRPYAAWLRTRLDYFEVAQELERATPPSQSIPGQPTPPRANPSAEVERRVWVKALEQRAAPVGAVQYAARLRPVFTQQMVPGELVWLAEVESSFNPAARSPAGAAGLYQLMPSTAQRFGLALRPRDERLQPEKNAAAAARYLRQLYGRFNDWPLTLAAYNAGEGNVLKLLDKYKARSFDRIVQHLPAETQMYVPKVEATLLRREGISLARLARPRK
jgi:membrane-bound lytic murein transglycosylase D